MSTNIAELFVVAWSKQQDGFHIEGVPEMLETNMRIYRNKTGADYIPLAFARTREEASKIIAKLEGAGKQA